MRQPTRGDALFVFPFAKSQAEVVVDYVIKCPSVATHSQAATTPGTAAESGYSDKLKLYTTFYAFPASSFAPLAIETGGRFHPATRAFLSLQATHHVRAGGADSEEPWNAQQKAAYAVAIRTLIVAISAAVAKSTADAIHHHQVACLGHCLAAHARLTRERVAVAPPSGVAVADPMPSA